MVLILDLMKVAQMMYIICLWNQNIIFLMIIDGVDIESYEGFYTLFAIDADLFPWGM